MNTLDEEGPHSFELYKVGDDGNRPWGHYTVIGVGELEDGEDYCEKWITVEPGKILSLQSHNFRAERWRVEEGTLTVILDGERFVLEEGETIDIPLRAIHCMANLTEKPCKVYEKQTGACREEDIIRYVDVYGRAKKDLLEERVRSSTVLYAQILKEIEEFSISSADKAVVVPVILCGGSGTRLWPWSREKFPKQFIRMLGDNSLLQETVDRCRRITGASSEQIVAVTLSDMRDPVVEQLNAITGAHMMDHVLSEPDARNTAAAIAYAALYVRTIFGDDAVMWVLPADAYMGREDNLKASYVHALEAAKKGCIVTFGIQPTRPETGYGYINRGASLDGDNVFKADGFYEKPDRATALSYIESGTFLWNSGMFLFQTGSVLAEFERYAPAILDGVRAAMEAGSEKHPDAVLYRAVEKQPFDKAIMEKTDAVAVVPCDPDWSDVGSWESLWELKERDEDGNATQGRVACHDTKDCLILGDGKRLIACAGLEDLVIVDTGDVLLVTDRKTADPLKQLVGKLKEDDVPEVLTRLSGADS